MLSTGDVEFDHPRGLFCVGQGVGDSERCKIKAPHGFYPINPRHQRVRDVADHQVERLDRGLGFQIHDAEGDRSCSIKSEWKGDRSLPQNGHRGRKGVV